MSETRTEDPIAFLARASRIAMPDTKELDDAAFIRVGIMLATQHPEWAVAYVQREERTKGRQAPRAALDSFLQMFPMTAETEEPDASAGLDRG